MSFSQELSKLTDVSELQRWTPVVQTFLLTLVAFFAEILYSLSLMMERTHPFSFSSFSDNERFHDYAEMGQFAILLVILSYTFCVSTRVRRPNRIKRYVKLPGRKRCPCMDRSGYASGEGVNKSCIDTIQIFH